MPINSVHVDAPLTNVSVAFVQDMDHFISGKVFPIIGSDKKSDLYYTYPRDAWFRDEAKKRGDCTETVGSTYTLGTDGFNTCVYAFHKDIGWQEDANADAVLDLEEDAARFVAQKLMIKKDRVWASTYFQTGIWASDFDVGASTPGFWNAAGSEPIAQLRAQMTAMERSTGYSANTLVLGADTWAALQDNDDFLDRIQFGTPSAPAMVSPNLLAQILGLDNVYIAKSVYNSANEGAPLNMDFIVSDGALLLYVNPTPSRLAPSAGYTFAWTGYTGAASNGMRTARFDLRHLACTRVEGEIAFDHKLVAADLGAFLHNTLSP